MNNTTATIAASPAALENGAIEYHGHIIMFKPTAGHPQAMNVMIDGKAAGFVIFPSSAVDYAKQKIASATATTVPNGLRTEQKSFQKV